MHFALVSFCMCSIIVFFYCKLPTTRLCRFFFFFFNDTATTEIYTLSLHDALPIFPLVFSRQGLVVEWLRWRAVRPRIALRSEEHTSELQSRLHLVCRLLLEKKKLMHV